MDFVQGGSIDIGFFLTKLKLIWLFPFLKKNFWYIHRYADNAKSFNIHTATAILETVLALEIFQAMLLLDVTVINFKLKESFKYPRVTL